MGVPVRIQRRLQQTRVNSSTRRGGSKCEATHSALRVATAIDILALGFLMTWPSSKTILRHLT